MYSDRIEAYEMESTNRDKKSTVPWKPISQEPETTTSETSTQTADEYEHAKALGSSYSESMKGKEVLLNQEVSIENIKTDQKGLNVARQDNIDGGWCYFLYNALSKMFSKFSEHFNGINKRDTKMNANIWNFYFPFAFWLT